MYLTTTFVFHFLTAFTWSSTLWMDKLWQTLVSIVKSTRHYYNKLVLEHLYTLKDVKRIVLRLKSIMLLLWSHDAELNAHIPIKHWIAIELLLESLCKYVCFELNWLSAVMTEFTMATQAAENSFPSRCDQHRSVSPSSPDWQPRPDSGDGYHKGQPRCRKPVVQAVCSQLLSSGRVDSGNCSSDSYTLCGYN